MSVVDAEIRGRPVRIAGLVGEALVLVAQHVIPLAEQHEMAARHQPQGTGLERVLLVADLLLLAASWSKARVVGGHDHQAELAENRSCSSVTFIASSSRFRPWSGRTKKPGFSVCGSAPAAGRTRSTARRPHHDAAEQHGGGDAVAQASSWRSYERPRRAVTRSACGGWVSAGRPSRAPGVLHFAGRIRYCLEPGVTASMTRSRLKLPGFWRGGNSLKLCSHRPT